MSEGRSPRLFVHEGWVDSVDLSSILVSAASGIEIDHRKTVEDRNAILDRARKLGIKIMASSGFERPNEAKDYVIHPEKIDRPEEEEILLDAVPEIKIPRTVQSFAEFDAQPFFPVVAKNRGSQGGANKFLLDNQDQWNLTRKVLLREGPLRKVDDATLQEYEAEHNKLNSLDPRSYEYAKQLSFVREWDEYLEDIQFPLKDMSPTVSFFNEYQQFIDTPSDHFTSYRVLVSAAGAIIASSLYYSAETKKNAKILTTDCDFSRANLVTDYFTHPESLTFLNARSFQSNSNRGGRGIVLDPTSSSIRPSEYDRSVLAAHGLNPINPLLPEEIRRQSTEIGRTLGRRLGIIVGIDWIQEKDTGDLYYIETNIDPGPKAYANAHMGGAESDDSLNEAHLAMHFAALESIRNS